MRPLVPRGGNGDGAGQPVVVLQLQRDHLLFAGTIAGQQEEDRAVALGGRAFLDRCEHPGEFGRREPLALRIAERDPYRSEDGSAEFIPPQVPLCKKGREALESDSGFRALVLGPALPRPHAVLAGVDSDRHCRANWRTTTPLKRSLRSCRSEHTDGRS